MYLTEIYQETVKQRLLNVLDVKKPANILNTGNAEYILHNLFRLNLCNNYRSQILINVNCLRYPAMAEDALKTYWDHFFKAETGTYEVRSMIEMSLGP